MFKIKKWVLILFVTLANLVFAADDLRLKVAAEYEKKGETQKALEEYRALLVENPGDFNAQLRAGNLQLKEKNYESAASFFKGALSSDPNSALALQGMARSQEGKGATEQAVLYWRKLSDLPGAKFKKSAEEQIQRLLKNVKDNSNKPAPIVEAKKEKVSNSKYDYNGNLFNAALKLHNQNKNTEALNAWRKVLAAQPGNPGAYYFAGVNRYNLGELDKAIYNFKKGFAYPEKGFNGHYYLGRIYEKKNEIALAKNHYNEYLKHTESAEGAKEVKAKLASLGKSETKEPIKEVAKVVETNRDSNEVIKATNEAIDEQKSVENKKYKSEVMNKGGIWVFVEDTEAGSDLIRNAYKKYRDGKMTDAVDRLKSAMLKYPGSETQKAAYHNYISMLNELGLDKEALMQANLSLAKKPGEPFRSAAKFNLAKSFFNLSEIDSSLGALKGIISDGDLGPTKAELNSFESTLARSSKKEKESVQKLRLALENEKDPLKEMELNLSLAKALAPTASSESIEILKKLSEKCLNQSETTCRKAKLTLADLLFKQEQYEDSKFYYQKMISENPDEKDSPWAKYQLANISRKLGNIKEAIKLYNEVIEKHSKSYWAQQAAWKRDDTIWRDQFKETNQD